jgi:hypothetical protein
MNVFDDFDCWPAWLKAVVIMFPILLLLILICFLYVGYEKIKRRIQKCFTVPNLSDINLTVKGATVHFMINKRTRISKFVPFFLVMFSLLTVSSACDASFSISTLETVCTEGLNNTKNCVINGVTLATIPSVGMEICYDIVDLKTNLIEGRISVYYLDAAVNVGTKLDYWTAGWQMIPFSVKMCGHWDYCNSTVNCDTAVTNQITMDGAITGDSVLFPGVSTCLSTCGCAGCKCVICTSACLRCRWALKVNGSPYKVLAPLAITKVPRVRICWITTGGHSSCSTRYVDTKTPIGIYGGFFTYLGSLSDTVTLLGTDKFIMSADGKDVFFGSASLPSLPVIGGIGDIQSGTEADLQNPNPHSYVFNPNQFTMHDAGDSCDFNGVNSGIQNLAFLLKLPQTIGPYHLLSNGNQVISGIHMDPGNMLVSLKLVNVTLTNIISEICPDLKAGKVSGAYKSAGGAMG